jgi:uncharacterized protein (DUF433 family)
MSRYPLNLPAQLKQEAERWAAAQGVSLNQFILWALAEKVGGLGERLDDPRFPRVTYRRGAAGAPEPVLRGTAIRVRTLAVAATAWGWSPSRIAEEYDLSHEQAQEALDFYAAHRPEIDALTTAQARPVASEAAPAASGA